MKKTTFVLLAFAAISLSSCEKNYTCTCIHTFSNPTTYAYSVDTSKTNIHDTKKNAGKKCDDIELSLNAGVASTATCTLN